MTESEMTKTYQDLRETMQSQEDIDFFNQILLVLYDLVGGGKENDFKAIQNLTWAFFRADIVGPEITRFREYTANDHQKAYDILANPQELKKFQESRNQS